MPRAKATPANQFNDDLDHFQEEVCPFDLEKLPRGNKNRWRLQSAFLSAFAACGNDAAAAKLANCTLTALANWKKEDILGFKERYEESFQVFCSRLEGKALELADGLKPGQNALILITLLNANMPWKFKFGTSGTNEKSIDVVKEMKDWIKKDGVVKNPARTFKGKDPTDGPPELDYSDDSVLTPMEQVDRLLRLKGKQTGSDGIRAS